MAIDGDISTVKVLIAALGGEGGGVLTDWIVNAVRAADLPVQSTSIPGLAQRTGATTYYIEILPRPASELGEAWPVMGLYPRPGWVDLMVASELLETGRALEKGFVTPDRTTLIASTSRVYAIGEKSAMGDGRYDDARIRDAAPRFAKTAILDDLAALAEGVASQINAVLLGAIAGCGALPVPADNFRTAIRDKGVAVDANLRGFEAGLGLAAPRPEGKTDSALDAFPAGVAEILAAGVARVADHQDVAHGRLYLERLAPIRDLEDAPPELLRETGRQLALWMAYEDVIRVAQLKTRRGRHARVRGEVRAKPGEPVRVAEYFAPGAEEIAAILPAGLGRALLRWGGNWRLHLRMRSDTVIGFLSMRLLATFRPMRTISLRYGEEQSQIERWLDAVRRAAKIDVGLALEVVECAGLNKGYGETAARGRANFLGVLGQIVDPVLTGDAPAEGAAERVARARRAALADPDGAALGEILDGVPEAATRAAAE
jgi:indolepyruvate ferredoxin oxidoreductase beta subunit